MIFLVLLFTAISAWSDVNNLAEIDYTYRTTADAQDFWSIKAGTGPRTNLVWPYEAQPDHAQGWLSQALVSEVRSSTLQYNRLQAQFGYLYSPNPKQSWGVLGGVHQHKQEKGVSENRSSPVGEIWTARKFEAGHFAQIKFKSHYALDRIAPLSGSLRGLEAFSVYPEATVFASTSQKVTYRGQYDWLIDGNTHGISDLQALQALSRDELWLWVGLGAEYTSNSTRQTGYWSPPMAVSYGLRYEFSYSFGEWSIVSGGSAHRLKEAREGSGHYFLSAIQYGKRGYAQVRAGFESVNSLQGARHWSSQSAIVQFTFAH